MTGEVEVPVLSAKEEVFVWFGESIFGEREKGVAEGQGGQCGVLGSLALYHQISLDERSESLWNQTGA